jgi:hypothetical protein
MTGNIIEQVAFPVCQTQRILCLLLFGDINSSTEN